MRITLQNINDVYRAKMCSVETMELLGYELINELFVDSSGFGLDTEPALTQSQFMRELSQIIKDNGGQVTAKITNAGQFQVYVGLFKKTGTKRSHKIGNNTYRIDHADGVEKGFSIRLHDTDILKFDPQARTVTLDNGGWQTSTTSKRMTQWLPMGLSVFQKDWTWYVRDTRNGDEKITEYQNGMTIKL